MNRSPMPPRKEPMKRGTGLARSALKTAVRDAAPVRGRGLAPSRGRNSDPSRRMRKLVLERDEFLCVRCGIGITGRPHNIHHRLRRGQEVLNIPENLITLCGSATTGCHGWVHANVAEARDSGWLLLGTDNPALKPLLVISEFGSGSTQWPTSDYRYTAVPPEGSAAA